MCSLKRNLSAEDEMTKKQRSCFSAIRTAFIVMYFIVVPFCQSPSWCLDYYKAQGMRNFGLYDCGLVSELTRVRYAAFPSFSPLLTCLIDGLCMIAFCGMMCYETKWRNQSKGEKRRTAVLVIACTISAIDLVRAFLALAHPYFADCMRIVVLLCMSQSLRQRCMSLISDLKDSFAILVTIFSYIMLFVLTVYYFYRPTFEGIMSFNTLKDTYRNMTVLFTTANFPDIFLPAMNINYFNAFLFMGFMLIGLYFLTNLLLANVFNKYMARLEAKRGRRIAKRLEYIE